MLKKEQASDEDEEENFFKAKKGKQRDLDEKLPAAATANKRMKVEFGPDGKPGRSGVVGNSAYLESLREKNIQELVIRPEAEVSSDDE